MKNVLVTGGSRGIGKAIAVRLGREGYRVGIIYRKSEKSAREVAGEIAKSGGVAVIYRADVSQFEEVKNVVENFCKKFGEIHALVLNAGIYIRRNIYEMSADDWDKTIKVNLYGSFYPVLTSLKCMKSGSIIFISSQLAFKGSKSSVAYSASKAGILGLMRSLAIQLAPDIRVNAIAPGTVDTDIIKDYTPEQRRRREEEIPLGRIGKPEEIAAVVSFLLSNDASYITGATIDVNGGLYIR